MEKTTTTGDEEPLQKLKEWCLKKGFNNAMDLATKLRDEEFDSATNNK